jgi:hypothetical protein
MPLPHRFVAGIRFAALVTLLGASGCHSIYLFFRRCRRTVTHSSRSRSIPHNDSLTVADGVHRTRYYVLLFTAQERQESSAVFIRNTSNIVSGGVSIP